MPAALRYLLLQIRNPGDPVAAQEVACFARVLGCAKEQIATGDLLAGRPSEAELSRADVVLIGGSGHYSAAGEGVWLDRTLDLLRDLYHTAKPTFASCWGCQAMARALGGQVINDPAHAELGTIELELSEAGRDDPVFGILPAEFTGQAGHEDSVLVLPEGTTLLASSRRVANQAYRFDGKPIYCTQFHPELNREEFLGRIACYPQYVERIARVPFATFAVACRDTPESEALLRRFVEVVFPQ